MGPPIRSYVPATCNPPVLPQPPSYFLGDECPVMPSEGAPYSLDSHALRYVEPGIKVPDILVCDPRYPLRLRVLTPVVTVPVDFGGNGLPILHTAFQLPRA